jgi:hypothetical protein
MQRKGCALVEGASCHFHFLIGRMVLQPAETPNHESIAAVSRLFPEKPKSASTLSLARLKRTANPCN